MPIGEKFGGATYFMLETHYDNPSIEQNLVDTSGKSLTLLDMHFGIFCYNGFTCICIRLKSFHLFSSGIRILYTDKLRQYDTGMMLIGTEVNFLHMIPPLQNSFLSLGRCTSDCTSIVSV